MGTNGGKATAVILRQKAIEDYYSNPNICESCEKIIEVLDHQKVPDVRKKRFCSQKCNGSSRKKTEEPKERKIALRNVTLEQLRGRTSNYQSYRSAIRLNAFNIFMKSDEEKSCIICGYSNYIEVCHIKAVSEFLPESLVSEVNDIENMIALCPNHHWEFDNDLLNVAGISKGGMPVS